MEEQNRAYEQIYNQMISQHQQKSFQFDTSCNPDGFRYLKILSVVKRNDENVAFSMRNQMQKVFTAMWNIQQKFQMIFRFNGSEVQVFVGTYHEDIHYIKACLNVLRSTMESSVSGIAFETVNIHSSNPRIFTFNEVYDKSYRYMGMFSGNPVVGDATESQNTLSSIDELLLGSTGMPWMFCISATPIQEAQVQDYYHHWLNTLTDCSEYVKTSYNFNAASEGVSMTTNKTYSGAEIYQDMAKSFCNIYAEAMQCGQWSVSMLCFAPTEMGTNLFGGVMAAQLKSGSEEIKRPLPFIYRFQREYNEVLPAMQSAFSASCTILSSRELSVICALPVRDTCGFQVLDRADFDIHRSNSGNMCIGNIINGHRITESEYRIDISTLNRHGLIIGLTGGGKTNTIKSLLHSVRSLHCPFLVIEPAKKEYFELYRMGMTELQVYSVGSLDGNTLKINPFEVMRTEQGRNVALQSHIDTVFAAFKASFIMYTPMPYVLETAIYEIYRDYGWDVETGTNRYGWWEFPTIEDLYYKIEPVVRNMGYDEKMQNDLTGSLKARINSLRVGSKGKTLNVARSIPMEKLLKGNVVIELDDVGDEDAKAFIISLLLMQIQECRKVQDTMQLELQHLLLIEEAHRLLKNVSSGSGENADPRGNAVEYFCNMLAELRSKGQGFLVIDQIPSKLAPDLVKNTNLKIIHRTVAEEDRTLVGGAMHMNDEQKEYLACLGQGVAAVYSEGDNHPKLVKLPYAGVYESDPRLKQLQRQQIIQLSGENCQKQELDERYSNQMHCNPVCRHCRNVHCTQNWANPEQSVRRKLPEKLVETVLQEVYKRNLADTLVWLYQKLPIISGITGVEHRRLETCLMAAWFQQHHEKLDYSLYAKLSSYLIDAMYIENSTD